MVPADVLGMIFTHLRAVSRQSLLEKLIFSHNEPIMTDPRFQGVSIRKLANAMTTCYGNISVNAKYLIQFSEVHSKFCLNFI